MQETKIRRENKEILTEILRKRVGVEKQERGEKIQVTIDRKKKLVVHAGIRQTIRSQKPELNIRKNVTAQVPQQVKDMRSYLGMDPLEWDSQA